jgi:hypothetical protein
MTRIVPFHAPAPTRAREEQARAELRALDAEIERRVAEWRAEKEREQRVAPRLPLRWLALVVPVAFFAGMCALGAADQAREAGELGRALAAGGAAVVVLATAVVIDTLWGADRRGR